MGQAWLTSTRLNHSHVSEFLIPQAAVPHLVGKGGHTFREAEDRLGVIISITDTVDDQEALVGLFGP